mgnify:CR=1 FL=1|jgi:hypothetical protein
MTLQWKRNCKLTIQIDANEPKALDLSQFKIVFQVSQATTDQPKAAEIYIYNLSANTMNLLAGVDSQKINTQVVLECGYGSELSVVFKGRVFQYRRGRDNPTDTWLCVLAISGDVVRNEALVNVCLPAGTSKSEAGNTLIEETNKYGLVTGEIADISEQQYPRGRVFFGSLHESIQQFGKENNVEFDYADDVISSISTLRYSVEPVQELTPKTGLVGLPQLTSEGLIVKCLLNPKLKRKGRIQIDMSNLQTESYDIAWGSQGLDQPHKNPKTAASADGMFVIQAIEHTGDTRGDEWYTHLVCTAINAVVPKTGITINAAD